MTKFDETAAGVYVIAPTPFLQDGAIDWDSTDRMVDRYLAAGATGLTVLGMMGEAPKLSATESVARLRLHTVLGLVHREHGLAREALGVGVGARSHAEGTGRRLFVHRSRVMHGGVDAVLCEAGLDAVALGPLGHAQRVLVIDVGRAFHPA